MEKVAIPFWNGIGGTISGIEMEGETWEIRKNWNYCRRILVRGSIFPRKANGDWYRTATSLPVALASLMASS